MKTVYVMFWDAAPLLLRFLSGSLWHRINKGLGLGGDPAQKDHGGGVQKLPVFLRDSVNCMGIFCHGGWHAQEQREQAGFVSLLRILGVL